MYEKNLCCPPYAPSYKETQEMIKCYSKAILFCTHNMNLATSLAFETAGKMFSDDWYKVIAFGAGGCKKCSKCNLEYCNFPRQTVPSMEACGIDVFATVRVDNFEGYQADVHMYKENKVKNKASFSMVLHDKVYTDKKEAGTALINICISTKVPENGLLIGEYQGFNMSLHYNTSFAGFKTSLTGRISHDVETGSDISGNIQRINNALEEMEKHMAKTGHQLETAEREVAKPFAHEQELTEKLARLNELNAMLDLDGSTVSLEKPQEKDGTVKSRLENDKTTDIRTENVKTGEKNSRNPTIKEKLALAKEKASQCQKPEKKTAAKNRAYEKVL